MEERKEGRHVYLQTQEITMILHIREEEGKFDAYYVPMEGTRPVKVWSLELQALLKDTAQVMDDTLKNLYNQK